MKENNLGSSLSADLSTSYGDTADVLGADLNTTNSKVNAIATRVNGIQAVLEQHGITAEAA